MKPGRGKQKGSHFERQICESLSLWVSHGVSRDLFWRSAMSGGRATVGGKKGVDLRRQAGDICAVAPEGHSLTDRWYIECKFYRSLKLEHFVVGYAGPLASFWSTTRREAKKYDRMPMLIAKQNRMPILVLTQDDSMVNATLYQRPLFTCQDVDARSITVHLLDAVLKGDYRRSRPKIGG